MPLWSCAFQLLSCSFEINSGIPGYITWYLVIRHCPHGTWSFWFAFYFLKPPLLSLYHLPDSTPSSSSKWSIKKLVTGGKGWSQKLLVCVRFCHLTSFMFSLKCLFNTTLTSCYTSGLEKNIRRIAGSKYSSSLQISSGPLHWNLMPAVLWFFSLPFQICVIFLLVFFC